MIKKIILFALILTGCSKYDGHYSSELIPSENELIVVKSLGIYSNGNGTSYFIVSFETLKKDTGWYKTKEIDFNVKDTIRFKGLK